jgi:pumilio RNA-binding family
MLYPTSALSSLYLHRCRVIQTAITNIEHEDLIELVSEFRGHALSLIHDPNGNHVIQRMIEASSEHTRSSDARDEDESASSLTAKLQFIIDDVVEHVESLSAHSYGCRVVQRALEFCNEKQKNAVIKGIIKCKEKLMKDQYGNYVIQQAIVIGDESTRDAILDCILNGSGPESLLLLSKHKYASNVVEKFIQMGSVQHREMIIKESLKSRGNSEVCIAVEMAKDNIANYVIKTAIDCARADLKKQILDELSRNLIELSKYPQATYIFSKESGSVASA